MKAQKKPSKSDHEKRVQGLKNEIANIVVAITKIGYSEALLSALQANEDELRRLSVVTENSQQESILNIPELLGMAPEVVKAKLAQRVDKIRMLPQPDGSYVAEGVYNWSGAWGPVMVAGAGFEPATFGL
jgi:hypothetical protein